MATTSRRAATAVMRKLELEQVELFQALRLLERLACKAQSRPTRIHFSTTSKLDFPAASIRNTKVDDDEKNQLTVEINIFGLTGSAGVLPFHYSELIQQRQRLQDNTLKSFFDLFNHRLVQLFQQASRKYRLPFSYEYQQLRQPRSADSFGLTLAGLSGLATGHIEQQLPLPKEDLLGMAGILSRPIRSAVAIERLLRYYFDLPIKIRQFQGEWLDIPSDIQTRLPSYAQPLGMNCELGTNVIIGSRGWQIQSKFSVAISNISYDELMQLQPGSPKMTRLRSLVKFLIHDEYDFDVIISIDDRAIPALILDDTPDTPPLLGWTSVLGKERRAENIVIATN